MPCTVYRKNPTDGDFHHPDPCCPTRKAIPEEEAVCKNVDDVSVSFVVSSHRGQRSRRIVMEECPACRKIEPQK